MKDNCKVLWPGSSTRKKLDKDWPQRDQPQKSRSQIVILHFSPGAIPVLQSSPAVSYWRVAARLAILDWSRGDHDGWLRVDLAGSRNP
jgi:hypothetical protein